MLNQIIQENWFENLQSVESIILLIVFYLLFLLILTIFLKIGIVLVESENTGFGQVFLTAFLIDLVFTILGLFLIWWLTLIIGLLVMWALINARHETGFGKAILVSLIALVIFIVMLVIIALIFNVQFGFLIPNL